MYSNFALFINQNVHFMSNVINYRQMYLGCLRSALNSRYYHLALGYLKGYLFNSFSNNKIGIV